jgi:glycosyltransferase involved in cell wall biosynthesis
MIAARRTLRRLRDGARQGRLAFSRLGARGAIAAAHRRLNMPAETAADAMPARGTAFDAIYAIGYREGEPKRYRVHNPAEALRARGYAVHVIDFADIDAIRRQGWTARALVLFRAEYDWLAGIAGVLAYARAHAIRVVYDIDDLVFDETLAEHIDGLRLMRGYERRRFLAAMPARRRLLLAADLVTVTTEPLARAARRLGRDSLVIPNALNREQLCLADEIVSAPRPSGDAVRIGYFSGSPTHQRDFAECEPALLTLMDQDPRVRFRLVGWLELSAAWDRHRDRIERLGFMPADQLMRTGAEADINLAPLEAGNPFCEAKSELKFFEAAAVGVPTVATATEPLAAAIEDGASGVLIRDRRDWLAALEALVCDAERRRRLGAAARAAALQRYTPDAVLPLTIAALGLDPALAPAERVLAGAG